MPAIPVPAAPPPPRTPLMGGQSMFEHGDRVYIQTPVQQFVPSSEEVQRYAFSQAVQQEIQAAGLKDKAPNENILWLKGSYVEADHPNRNGTAWRAQELRIKKLTPILMPITVMHDPRTAVGVIADSILREPGKDGVTRTTIDTVLAVWAHRFPDIANEAAVNLEQGTLMQSMECYSPWYECSECGAIFHKLPHGVERANWCEHLKAADLPDDSMRAAASPELSQPANASRILGDVCFTGTGLIFGTRGAKGAFREAYLEEFQDELAQHFQNVHTATAATTSPTRSTPGMSEVVQIEKSELDLLRKERDDARAEATAAKTAQTAAETKVTELEAQVSTISTEKDTLAREKTDLEEKANQATLKDTRLKALGEGFKAKLATLPTTRDRLEAKAATCTDEDWDAELKVVEETADVKRDAKKDGNADPDPATQADATPDFSLEQIASAATPGVTPGKQPDKVVSQQERSSVIGTLAGAFQK